MTAPTTIPNAQNITGNLSVLSELLESAQKILLLPLLIAAIILGVLLYFHFKKEVLKKAAVNEEDRKTFVQPLLFLCNNSVNQEFKDRLKYSSIVKFIAGRIFPRRGENNTSPIYFIFANPACGKTKFAKDLRTELTLRYWRKNHIIKLANKRAGEIHSADPVTQVKLFFCRNFNSETDSFSALKKCIDENKNSVLIFDGFDELLPGDSVDGIAACGKDWRQEKLFEIIKQLDRDDRGNTIVITYRTEDNPDLKTNIKKKTISGRRISRLEICEYHKDSIPEKAAVKYAQRVFAVNNRKTVFNHNEGADSGKITFWQKVKIKKAIKKLYLTEDTNGKFIAIPLYSAYASMLLDIKDLSKLSKEEYFNKMVDILLDRETDKYKRNSNTEEREEFKKSLKTKLIDLASHFSSKDIFEIDTNDDKITAFGTELPTLFLQCKDNDTKYEFQHEEFIRHFNKLKIEQGEKIYTIVEKDSRISKGNHLTFSQSSRIQWRILEYRNRENKVLLISELIIDTHTFSDDGEKGNGWDTSDIKAYLNGGFINSTFSPAERAEIQGEDGEKIFLLSLDEAKTYFSSDKDRIAYPSDSCEKKITEMNKEEKEDLKRWNGAWWWWLRSPGYRRKNAAYVHSDGYLTMDGNRVFIAAGGVRPALWLNL